MNKKMRPTQLVRLLSRSYLFIVLALFAGCAGQTEDVGSTKAFFEVNLPDDLRATQQLNLSDIADTVKYTILETNDNCLISSIKDIKLHKDIWFIQTTEQELFTFTKSGKFLNKIGKRGKGPSEYYSLIDFAVTDSNVYILDYANRLAQYNYSGSFKQYIKLPKQASRIMFLHNNKVACYVPDLQFDDGDELYNWLLLNVDGDSIGTITTPFARKRSEKVKKISDHFVLTDFSGQHPFTFKEAFNDSLYYIDTLSQQAVAYAFINQGIHKIDFNKTFEQITVADHNMRINKLIDSPKFLFISYRCMCNGNEQTHHSIFNKSTLSFYNLEDKNGEENIENDFNEGLNFVPITILTTNEIIGVIDAYRVIDSSHLPGLNKHINETDNPVLVVATIKEEDI